MQKLTEIYTISAEWGGKARSERRCRAGSAMVLADRWAREGCVNVTVIDAKGIARSRKRFRPMLYASLNAGPG